MERVGSLLKNSSSLSLNPSESVSASIGLVGGEPKTSSPSSIPSPSVSGKVGSEECSSTSAKSSIPSLSVSDSNGLESALETLSSL